MNYQEFRKDWFNRLPEGVKREQMSMSALDIDCELELLCQEEFARRLQ